MPMAMPIEFKHPLRVPKGWDTTPQVHRNFSNGFKPDLTLKDALQYLVEEINLFGAQHVVVYSDVDNLNNERLRRRIGQETGICVQITVHDEKYNLFCDRWQLIEHNIYALHLVMRNLKNNEKWGVGDLKRIMRGYQDLSASNAKTQSASTMNTTEWMAALGLGPTATVEDADAVYRRRAKSLADNPEALLQLNQAIEIARQQLKG